MTIASNHSVVDEPRARPVEKSLVYLADLTYTGRVMASNMMPLGVGLVGAYLLKREVMLIWSCSITRPTCLKHYRPVFRML